MYIYVHMLVNACLYLYMSSYPQISTKSSYLWLRSRHPWNRYFVVWGSLYNIIPIKVAHYIETCISDARDQSLVFKEVLKFEDLNDFSMIMAPQTELGGDAPQDADGAMYQPCESNQLLSPAAPQASGDVSDAGGNTQ